MVEKVLVTAHDITRLLILEDEARNQRQELTIIRRILDVPVPSFHSFIRKSEQLLQECEAMAGDLHETFRKILLMHIHTLKGMARSLYFNEIAELCHRIEEKSSEVKREELQSLLRELKGLVHIYRDTALHKLGRRLAPAETVELPAEFLRNVLHDLDAKGLGKDALERVQTLELSLFRPLTEVLAAALKTTVPLALELGKAEPGLKIEAEGLGVTQSGADVLMGILAHLVRNSMDHGLESLAERQSSGKNPKGLISVIAEVTGSQLKLVFSDDGRGLNMQELRKLGVQKNLIQAGASLLEVAELIFQPELTTREVVSHVSGRGIGLAAVREHLRREGGDACINLRTADAAATFQEFCVHIVLPKTFWTRLHQVNLAIPA
jgi:chemotaxis protein histidine kinase CheA